MISPSIKVLLAVSSLEAINLSAKELDIEHIFLGLLKLGDFREKSALFKDFSDEEWGNVLFEIDNLTKYWKKRRVSRKEARRRLRRILLGTNYLRGKFTGHRTARCRKLFYQAEELAGYRGQSELGFNHFLIACLKTKSIPLDQLFRDLNIKRRQLFSTSWAAYEKQRIGAIDLDHDRYGKYGRDLTALARQEKLNPVIGRKGEIKSIAQVLSQSLRNNPIIIGEPGVGKTAVVEGLAQFSVKSESPEPIRDLHFIEVTVSALVAGAAFRGQFEKRLLEIIRLGKENPNLVFFIDEIHTIIGAGGGRLDGANILKPALARGEIRCIGATTVAEYRKYIERDAAFARRFQTILVEEPTRDETIEILKGVRQRLENHHQIKISDSLIVEAVDLSTKYIKDTNLPDKAIMVLDEACSRRRLLTFTNLSLSSAPLELYIDDIAEAVSHRSNIPVEVILQSDEDRLQQLEEQLKQRVIGQDDAVIVLSRLVRSHRAGLLHPERPVVVLFAGPSGTGKTELAKAITETLYYDEKNLIRLDMSEYMEKHNVAKILGSPPGYIGFGDEPYLIREIRQRPSSVVLLDEIEKAHPDVVNIFLQIFDEGRMTDAKGKIINFSEAIIILTSNLGTKKDTELVGFKLGMEEGEEKKIREFEIYKDNVQEAIKEFFLPELLNRIQETVVFKPLSKQSIDRIIDKFIDQLNKRLAEKNVTVKLDTSAREYLIENGYSEEYGARNLSRIVEQSINDPLSRAILAGKIKGNKIAFFRQENGSIVMDLLDQVS